MAAPSLPEMRHTNALRYSRWEQLYYRLYGHWPQSVVDRRLAALDADKAAESIRQSPPWSD